MISFFFFNNFKLFKIIPKIKIFINFFQKFWGRPRPPRSLRWSVAIDTKGHFGFRCFHHSSLSFHHPSLKTSGSHEARICSEILFLSLNFH